MLASRLVALQIAMTASVAQAVAPAAPVEEAVVRRVNEIRRTAGLEHLAPDMKLAELARDHSCRMARDNLLAHDAGGSLAARVGSAGIAYRAIGENLARIASGGDPVERAVDGWMKSQGHRANILSADFTTTGVGVCRRDDGAYYVTQLFVKLGASNTPEAPRTLGTAPAKPWRSSITGTDS